MLSLNHSRPETDLLNFVTETLNQLTFVFHWSHKIPMNYIPVCKPFVLSKAKELLQIFWNMNEMSLGERWYLQQKIRKLTHTIKTSDQAQQMNSSAIL